MPIIGDTTTPPFLTTLSPASTTGEVTVTPSTTRVGNGTVNETSTIGDSTTYKTHPTTTYGTYQFPAWTTSTNLGPLTSPLSFNPNCFSNMYDLQKDGLGPSGAWKTLGCAISTCCPSDNFYTEDWAWMTSYYSPGVCPHQYQSCSPPTRSGLILTPAAHEKIVFCCPDGERTFSNPHVKLVPHSSEFPFTSLFYSDDVAPDSICPNQEDMLSEVPGACGSRLTLSSTPTPYTVLDGIHNQTPVSTVPYDFEPGYTQEVQIIYPIQIRLYSNTTNTPLGPPKLSTGAIVGIAVGAVAAFILAVSSLLLYLHRRKARRNNATTTTQRPEVEIVPPSTPTPGIQELPTPMTMPPPEYVRNEPVRLFELESPPHSPAAVDQSNSSLKNATEVPSRKVGHVAKLPC